MLAEQKDWILVAQSADKTHKNESGSRGHLEDKLLLFPSLIPPPPPLKNLSEQKKPTLPFRLH